MLPEVYGDEIIKKWRENEDKIPGTKIIIFTNFWFDNYNQWLKDGEFDGGQGGYDAPSELLQTVWWVWRSRLNLIN